MFYTGTIMEIENNKAYIFTEDCQMISINSKEEYFVGQQLKFTDDDISKPNIIHRLGKVKSIISLAAVFAVVITTGILIHNFTEKSAGDFNNESTALIAMDINPGVEFNINKDDVIISADSTNEDGSIILEEIVVEGKKIEEGINAVIEKSKEKDYIKDNKNIILLSAVIKDGSDDEEKYKLQIKDILSKIENDSQYSFVTVLVMDEHIISDAKDDQLSIGRELLYKYAQGIGKNISLKTVTESSVNELIEKLEIIQQGKINENFIKGAENGFKDFDIITTDISETSEVTTESTTIIKTETSEETTSIIEESTIAQTSKVIETSKESDNSEPTNDTDATIFTNPKLTGSVNNGNLFFSWTALPNSNVSYNGQEYTGFKYYKIVASETNPNPVYPQDGYLKYFSDTGTSNWTFNPETDHYNLKPEIVSGKTYYFSVTYVFENGKITSNSITLTTPQTQVETEPPVIDQQFNMDVTANGDTLNFSWTPLNSTNIVYNGKEYTGFKYYKIVASETNSNPAYPADGYLKYFSDTDTSSWTFNPETDHYNLKPEIVSGKTYYFSVTYVFENGKIPANAVQITVP